VCSAQGARRPPLSELPTTDERGARTPPPSCVLCELDCRLPPPATQEADTNAVNQHGFHVTRVPWTITPPYPSPCPVCAVRHTHMGSIQDAMVTVTRPFQPKETSITPLASAGRAHTPPEQCARTHASTRASRFNYDFTARLQPNRTERGHRGRAGRDAKLQRCLVRGRRGP
jgi:hypothetical protein